MTNDDRRRPATAANAHAAKAGSLDTDGTARGCSALQPVSRRTPTHPSASSTENAARRELATCPGSATVSITCGIPASQLDGTFDAGELYQVTFAACTGAAGLAQLDGMLAMTIESATGDSANGTLALSPAARAAAAAAGSDR